MEAPDADLHHPEDACSPAFVRCIEQIYLTALSGRRLLQLRAGFHYQVYYVLCRCGAGLLVLACTHFGLQLQHSIAAPPSYKSPVL